SGPSTAAPAATTSTTARSPPPSPSLNGDFSSGTATNIAGGFTNIQALDGNDGAASALTTLTGPAMADTWTVGSHNMGTVSDGGNLFNFAQTGNLVGGTLADTFAFQAGGSLSGSIDGKA